MCRYEFWPHINYFRLLMVQLRIYIFFNMIIRNYATNLIFFTLLTGRPMTGDQSTNNASVYHILSCFLIFTGSTVEIHIL